MPLTREIRSIIEHYEAEEGTIIRFEAGRRMATGAKKVKRVVVQKTITGADINELLEAYLDYIRSGFDEDTAQGLAAFDLDMRGEYLGDDLRIYIRGGLYRLDIELGGIQEVEVC